MLFSLEFNGGTIYFPSNLKVHHSKDNRPFFQYRISDNIPLEGSGEFNFKYICGDQLVFDYLIPESTCWVQCAAKEESNFLVQLNVIDGKLNKIVIHINAIKNKKLPEVASSTHLLEI